MGKELELGLEIYSSPLEIHPLQRTKNLEQSITLKQSKKAEPKWIWSFLGVFATLPSELVDIVNLTSELIF